jgi:ABC-type phosphate/phosphonate transport system substrate-binding protein
LNPTLAAKIKKLFLEMDRTEEGRRVLKDFQATTKFDELPPHALDPIQKILDMPAGPQPPDE